MQELSVDKIIRVCEQCAWKHRESLLNHVLMYLNWIKGVTFLQLSKVHHKRSLSVIPYKRRKLMVTLTKSVNEHYKKPFEFMLCLFDGIITELDRGRRF